MNEGGVQLMVDIPAPLCSQYPAPDKETAIQAMRSRFSLSQPHGIRHTADLGPEKST